MVHSASRLFSILISAICFLGLQTAQAGFPYWGYTPPPPGGTSLGGYSSLIISFQNTALNPPNFSFEEDDVTPDVGRLCISGKVVAYFSDNPTAKAVMDLVGTDTLGQEGICYDHVKRDCDTPSTLCTTDNGCDNFVCSYTSTVSNTETYNGTEQRKPISGSLVVNVDDTTKLFGGLTGRFETCPVEPLGEAVCDITLGVDNNFVANTANSCESAFPARTTPFGFNIGECEILRFDDACVTCPVNDTQDPLNLSRYTVFAQTGQWEGCEGGGFVSRVCHDGQSPGTASCFNTNDEGEFTRGVAEASVADTDPEFAQSVCIGPDVADMLALSAYVGEKIFITPCDDTQTGWEIPFKFTYDTIEFTSSEGDNALISGLMIEGMGASAENEKVIKVTESADKTASLWDFSDIELINVARIEGLELPDTIYAPKPNPLYPPVAILGGNGDDTIFGGACVDGGQNDDALYGDNPNTAPEANVFVFGDKIGKDEIFGFDADEGDLIVINSRTTAVVTELEPGTYVVALKGQNSVIVNVKDGGTFDFDAATNSSGDVISRSDYTGDACSGYPF